ncbi:MAG: hypothetical protein R3332_11645 [Pseudohongiellaceae bacterium]|nr:hypothetical protein [Pseudohongiellaceae bacterium]
MIHKPKAWKKPAKKLIQAIACTAVVTLSSQAVFAQAGDKIREQYPELADLFNAFDVTQAQTFEAINTINSEARYADDRKELRMHMEMMKNMTMSEMMASGMMNHSGMVHTHQHSPYADMEMQARMDLIKEMRAKHSDEQAHDAFSDSPVINRHAAEVIRQGRRFETRLFEIYIDDSIDDKVAAVEAAIADYLSDERHSVPPIPKESEFLVDHEQATGFKSAYPQLSGLLWTQQWLQLASLEAVILETLDPQFHNSVDTTLERFWNKIGTDSGMSMFPAPSELPMAPAIAPDLYSQSPQAAIILDNLNILETVLADILAYPNEKDIQEKMDAAVALFTNKEEAAPRSRDYLLFALRGGIYDQGGPAVGELTRSERNRSRDAMNMTHSGKMSSNQ